MEEGARACGASVIPAGTGSTESQLQTLRDLGVTAYIGTPSYLMAIIKKAEEDGADFKRDYGLKRADYINAFFQNIDWGVVAGRIV